MSRDLFLELINEYIDDQPQKQKFTCNNCESYEQLQFNPMNNSNICLECKCEYFNFEKSFMINNCYMYQIDPRNTILKKIIKINKSFPDDKKLSDVDINIIIDLYLDIKKIINSTTNRHNIFIFNFIIGRLLIHLNRGDLLNYINISLSLSTFKKYSQQWKLVCSNLKIVFNMDLIIINSYPKIKIT